MHEDAEDRERLRPMFVMGSSALDEEVPWAAHLAEEVLRETDFSDIERIRDIVAQGDFIDMETSLPNAEGDPIWCRYQSFVLFNGVGCPVRHVGRLLDTHEMVMREATLRKKAELDGLTGIFNREAAMTRIEKALTSEDCAKVAVSFSWTWTTSSR